MLLPTNIPSKHPRMLAKAAYITNFKEISKSPYPKAFIVPISILFSSTILVIVVKQIRTATIKKNTGNTDAMLSKLLIESLYPEYPGLSVLSNT